MFNETSVGLLSQSREDGIESELHSQMEISGPWLTRLEKD